MDQEVNFQDLVRCHIWDNPPTLHCDICHEHLCNDCEVKHIADKSKDHKVVPFKRRSYIFFFPSVQDTPKKTCERHCEQCGFPLCSQCISSDQHSNHKNIDILENLEKKKEDIKSDLQELVASISPRYQSIAGGFFNQIAYLHENCEKISLALDKQGEDWHREIDNIVKELKSNISDIKCKQLTFFSVGCRNPRNNFRNWHRNC